MSKTYSLLPHKYAESLLYVDLVDLLSVYRRFSKLTSLSQILGVRETSLSKYANGRIRPKTSKSISLVKILTDAKLVREVVMEYLRNESLVDLLMDTSFTKLIALSILEKIVSVFHGSRVETILTSSEAVLIASHVAHRLKSSLLNIHVMRSGSRLKNIGNSIMILIMADEEIIKELTRVKAESRKVDVKYIFLMIYSNEVGRLTSLFPNATVDCLIGLLSS
ncbi:MAG: hypothetical protein QXG17_06980 [Sulfolobales archaeon]